MIVLFKCLFSFYLVIDCVKANHTYSVLDFLASAATVADEVTGGNWRGEKSEKLRCKETDPWDLQRFICHNKYHILLLKVGFSVSEVCITD